MAIPHPSDQPHRDHPSVEPDTSQRVMGSRILPIVVLIVLLITIIATYYWYAA